MAVPKVKGANVLAAVRMLRANRDRAVALLPPQYHRYLQDRVLVSSWYPESDQLELLRAVSFLLPGTPDPWMVIGRIAARDDLKDLYRALVRPGDLKEVLRGVVVAVADLPRHRRAQADAGGGGAGDGDAARLRRDGALEMCRVIGGYVSEVTTVAAGCDVKAAKAACVLDGAGACSWRLTWRA